MFVLDTNVISELRAGKPMPSVSVRLWAGQVPANQLYLAPVTVLELEIGVLAMERKDSRQGRILRSWLHGIIKEFSSQVLPFTGSTAILCAAIDVPNRRSSRDAMIAATATEHGYTVVTRNTDDFAGCGVQLLNPWLPP
jgi:predicted nucleic acid-binding protein